MQIELKCKHFLGLGKDFSSSSTDSVATQRSYLCPQNLMIQTQLALLFGLEKTNTLLSSHEFFPNFNAHSIHRKGTVFKSLKKQLFTFNVVASMKKFPFER